MSLCLPAISVPVPHRYIKWSSSKINSVSEVIFLKIPQWFSMIFSIKSKFLNKAYITFMICRFLWPLPPTNTLLATICSHSEVPLPETPSPTLFWQFPLTLQDVIYVSSPLIKYYSVYYDKAPITPFLFSFLSTIPTRLGATWEGGFLFDLCILLWSNHSTWLLTSAG